MKKINLFTLFLSCFLLMGCGSTEGGGQSGGAHIHTATDDTYRHDENYHWHVCKECGEEFDKSKHVWDEESEHTTQPTCTKEGERVVIKRCSICGERKEYREPIDKLNHEYIAKYVWSNDYLSCTANYVCEMCGDISATETVDATISEYPASLSGEGWYTYTAVFTNPVFYTQTHVETIPQLSFEFELDEIGESYTLTACSSEIKSKKTFTIPSTYKGLPVTKIGKYAFSGASVVYVSIPDSVTEIEEYAFYNCASMTDIFLSDNIEIVDSDAFKGCSSLSPVQASTGLYYLTSNAGGGTPEPICLLRADKSVTNITIDYRCRVIASHAFQECKSLTKVYGGESLVGIGDLAFWFCEKLEKITIPNTIKHISKNAFSSCTSLAYNIYQNGKYLGNTNNPYLCLMECVDRGLDENSVIHEDCKYVFGFDSYKSAYVEVPEGVQALGDKAFAYTSFQSIKLPRSLTQIGKEAFFGSKLETISIPNSITYLPKSTFGYCESLESVVLPDTIKSIGLAAFANCVKLININTPADLAYLGESAFYRCESLSSYRLTSKIVTVPRDLFNSCISLREITIPEGITTIGSFAFSGCALLRNVTFPESLQIIREEAFKGCNAMTEVVIPKQVREISFRAFSHCGSLQAFTVEEGSPYYASKDGVLYHIENAGVPDPAVIVDGVNLAEFYMFPSGRTGSYVVPDYVRGFVTQAFCGSRISEITISNNITWLPSETFYECKNLKDVNFTGTKAQWNEMVENFSWFEWGQIPEEEMFDVTVHCSDGDIVVPKPNLEE